jgi:hypothetical protein
VALSRSNDKFSLDKIYSQSIVSFSECALRNIDLRLHEPSFYGSNSSQYDDGTGNFDSKIIYVDSTKFFVETAQIQYRVSTLAF